MEMIVDLSLVLFGRCAVKYHAHTGPVAVAFLFVLLCPPDTVTGTHSARGGCMNFRRSLPMARHYRIFSNLMEY
jgi:hypothetical protein